MLRQAAVWRVGLQIDISAQHVNAIAQSNDRRNIEGRDADGQHVDHRRQNSWERQGQRDTAHRPGEAHAMNLGGLFERRIHGAKHLRGENKRQSREVKSLHQAHPRRRGDVDRSLLQSKCVHEPAIQKPDAHVGDKSPTHCGIDARDQ